MSDRALLCLNGWEGPTRMEVEETEVEVIGRTPKRVRIRAIKRTKLAGPNHWLNAGETALVPSHAVVPVTMAYRALLCLNGWEGPTQTEVEVIGRTPKRLRIRAIKRTKLAGRNRWLNAGETALVPSHAVVPVTMALTYPE